MTATATTITGPLAPPVETPAKRCDVLGVGISAVNLDTAVATIGGWIATGAKHYVTVTGVHGVMESQRDGDLKAIHNAAGMVTPDGMPMVWLNWLAGNRDVDRVYGPDLMLRVCAASSEAEGWRHFFYGGGEGVAEQLTARLRERFPTMHVVGAYTPPFRKLTADEEHAVADEINAARPHIVWVGLSTPKQEYWMSRFRHRLDAPVLVGVGAAFDFHAGLKRQAPRLMQRCGLEWLFRLCCEPRRLWKRYLVNNPAFLWYLFLQRARLRSFHQSAAASPGR
jgi:N-acetylglucosaminyldiphosphoundecaprenol N-acetyl-beta-D-mannosaminyltransferase